MIAKFMEALFAPKYPKGYTGRHRAQLALVRAMTPERTPSQVTATREAVV